MEAGVVGRVMDASRAGKASAALLLVLYGKEERTKTTRRK